MYDGTVEAAETEGMVSLLDHNKKTWEDNYTLLDKNNKAAQGAMYNERLMFNRPIDVELSLNKGIQKVFVYIDIYIYVCLLINTDYSLKVNFSTV